MLTRIGIAAAIALLLSPDVAAAQRNVFAVGRPAFGYGWVMLQLGQELRPEKRRIGLQLFVDYSRQNTNDPIGQFVPSDSGVVVRETAMAQQKRVAGVWLATRYVPIRWFAEPYVIGGVGLQDRYHHWEIAAIDSMTLDGVSTPAQPARSYTESMLGWGVMAGLGVSARVQGIRLFAEARYRGALDFRSREYGRVVRADLPIVFGIRF